MTPRSVAPSLGRDVGWLVERWAAVDASRRFLTWVPVEGEPLTWTRGEFATDVRAFAAGLTARGVTAGDRVALVLPNCPELLVAWSAVTSMGAVAVCLDPRATADDLGYVAGPQRPARRDRLRPGGIDRGDGDAGRRRPRRPRSR